MRVGGRLTRDVGLRPGANTSSARGGMGAPGKPPPRLAGTAKKRHFRNDYSCSQKISPYTTDAPNIFNHNSPTFRTFLTDGYICAQISHGNLRQTPSYY
jgi:hypothetical protein